MNFFRLRFKTSNVSSLFVFFLVFFVSTPGFSTKVSVEGTEPILGRSISVVRDIALSNALKMAVENAARSVSPLMEDKYIEILRQEDYIPYIKAYRILYEASREGKYKITLEADVDSEKLKNRIRDFIGPGAKSSVKPPISIIVLLNPESDPAIESVSFQDIKREISVIFIGSGYKVVEQPGDVILETYVGVKTKKSQPGEDKYYVLGNVYIRAKNESGKLIAEMNDSSYLTGDELVETSERALEQAALKAASGLKSEFDKIWSSRDRTIEISFSGLRNYDQYEQVDRILHNSIFAIDSIDKTIFKDGEITFVVLPRVTPEELANILANWRSPTFSLKLNKVSSEGIEFSVIEE